MRTHGAMCISRIDSRLVVCTVAIVYVPIHHCEECERSLPIPRGTAPGTLGKPAERPFLKTGGTMKRQQKITKTCLAVFVFIAAQTISAQSLQPASPELVGELTKGLSI